MAEYNGWPSKTAWNVALWVGNDEQLYREAIRLKAKLSPSAAARIMMNNGFTRTPDGFKVSRTALARAIAGLE